MTPKRAAIAALSAVLVVVGVTVGAVQATTKPTKTTCSAKPVKAAHHNAHRVKVVCRPRVPSATVTKTVTATATVTKTVTAMATVTVNPLSSPAASPVSTQTPIQTASPTQTASSTPSSTPTPTATPISTPSSTPTSAPGSWPGASNTGVPAGTSLSGYTGSCTITSAVTIDAKTINCPGGLAIKSANVTITRSKVNGPIAVDTDTNRSWSLTLSDSEVDAGNVTATAAIGNGNVTITRANIHGGHNALQCEEHSSECTITDSWIHGQYLGANSADHLAGIGVFGGLSPCTGPNANGVPACFAAVHNSILCEPLPNSADGGCTADLAILTQFGPLHGALVQNNLFRANVGAASCTYGGFNPSNASDHIVYTGNVFERGTNSKCAAYGAVTSFDSGGTGNIWSDNTWDTGGSVPPAV